MKFSKIILSIYFIILLTVSCSKNSTEPEIIGEPDQFMVINIEPINLESFENEEIIIRSALSISGKVVADTLPSIEFVTVNDTTYMVESGLEIGEKTFSIIFDKEVSSISNIDIEVKTSIGTMYGSIAKPDSISNISFNPALPIQSNQKLTVMWEKSNPQYYHYMLFSRYNYFDEITKTNKIELPAIQFSSNGTYQLVIYGVNGPVPQEGAEGNMKGDGVGFLYFRNDYQYFYITVGD